jgi:hypothetical protein
VIVFDILNFELIDGWLVVGVVVGVVVVVKIK